MERPQTRYTKALDGTSLAFQVIGRGPIDLGYVPQMGSIELMWEDPVYCRFLERMASMGRVICADYPRLQGAYERAPLGPSTFERIFDDIHAGMDEVGSQRVVGVGEGANGLGMLLWAAMFPERTAGLVLINSYARWLRADDYRDGYPESLLNSILAMYDQGWGTGLVGQLFAPSRANDASFTSWHARVERMIQTPDGITKLTDWILRQDVRSILGSVKVPTLVLHRAENTVVRPALGRYLASNLPNAKYVELPGTDHAVYGDGVDMLLDEIEEFLTGTRPSPTHDRVLATVMFTDIVSSTERIAAIGDREWSGLLERHNEVVRRLVAEFRGRLVGSEGDGVLATFDGPGRAVRCACAIRDEVHRLGIEVRAGAHTGEVELAGADVRGMAVHIGARVSALAGPGEILVSRTVTDLVAGSGLEFAERGEHELKGVPGRWALFAVKGS